MPTACLQEFGAGVFRANRRAGERSSCATARETADMSTTLTEDHRGAFEALTRGEAGNFCLVSCSLSGRPAAAIAAVTVCPPAEDGGEPRIRDFSAVHFD